jgi:hypothetical protein
MNIKLAAYIDEVCDDPDKSCELLVSKNINNICLRRAWCRNIYNMPDNAIGILNDILLKHKMTPILLHTDIGCVEPDKLITEESKLVRAMHICKYLKCRSLRVGLGLSSNKENASECVLQWVTTISALSISYDLSILLEPDINCYYRQAAPIAILLNKFKRLRLLYDPALLVMQAKTDNFVKFWSLLKSKVSFIDIHDFKTGNSAKPAGYGDAQLDLLVADALSYNFPGWFCLEPGLGSRYGDIITKEKTFLCAFDAFESLLQRIQLPKIL